MKPSLTEAIERTAAKEGRERADVLTEFERAILDAAKEAWGSEREIEASFNDGNDKVELFQIIRVVEQVDPARVTKEIDLASAEALGASLGDELMIQVFYSDEDAPQARAQRELYSALPSLEVLATGLPFRGPEWMRSVWPQRRMPWRFGQPITLPSMTEALDIFGRWLSEVGVDLRNASGSPQEHLEEARRLGPTARDLVALYERFGPIRVERESAFLPREGWPLQVFGLALDSIPDALAHREMMNELVTGGHIEPASWRASWLPIFRIDAMSSICLDLSDGSIVKWDRESLERPIEAPSVAAWFGVLAVAAQCGLLHWDGDSVTQSLGPDCYFSELQRCALPGFPKAGNDA